MSLLNDNIRASIDEQRAPWNRARQSCPKANEPNSQVIKLRKMVPYQSFGELISSQKFWREVDKLADGWLCQDSFGQVKSMTMSSHSCLSKRLRNALDWFAERNLKLRLVVLVSRGSQNARELEIELHRLNRKLKECGMSKIRLCLITESDLLYIRNAPMKREVTNDDDDRVTYEPPKKS